MSERARLRWLCRRGTKELDLLLTRFLDESWDDAPPATRAAFARLLELQDPELYALLTGRADAPDPELADVVDRIRVASVH
jgi:antitoxin CptB